MSRAGRPRIAWLPGDGIGPEVLDAARLVLDASGFEADYEPGDIGWEFWKREGNPLPDRTIQVIRSCDAALFGAITSLPAGETENALDPPLRGRGFVYRSPIVRLRQELRLDAKIIRARSFPGNPKNHREGIDLVVVRENSEGLYAGIELRAPSREVREALGRASAAMHRFDGVAGEDMALACRIVTRDGARRIARVAFEIAAREGRDRVTIAEKPNVLRETSGMMIEEARSVAGEFPAVRLDEVNVDAITAGLVKDPLRYSVILASNLFGDILSDLAAELAGGIGLAPTANIGDTHAVFEPLHGSAPKYAGKGVANPTGAILSGAMLLERLGDDERAERVREGVARVIAQGAATTRDLGGWAGTREMAEAIADQVSFSARHSES
jgi:3-isopropylmalate dehydrogenase